jgi:predicted transcriptional regulator of viral defense system
MADGKYFFSKDEALLALGLSSSQFRYQAYRLKAKKAIRSLTQDSYMIIPAEYHNLGGVPPHWIIDSLMKHLTQDYYIGLLSAASMYGATHQQPMSFQVITNRTRRPIELERGMIEFYQFKECSFSIKEAVSSPTGYAQVSSKEQTLFDLVRFNQSCGYLSNVGSVIKDIVRYCNDDAFVEALSNEKNSSVIQRLGYLFEYIGSENFAGLVQKELSIRKIQFIQLRPDVKNDEGEINQRFKVIINDTLEIE